jgi:hypothetical protein
MASKKKPSIKVPLDDIVRNAMRALGKKNKKVGKAVKKADSAAEAKRYAEFKARRPSAAERAAKRSQFVPAETRQKGTQQMIREYDRGIKASQVNERLAKKDPNLLAFRESTGRPVTKKQIRDAKGADRGLKKNLPKKVKRETKKPEGQQTVNKHTRLRVVRIRLRILRSVSRSVLRCAKKTIKRSNHYG